MRTQEEGQKHDKFARQGGKHGTIYTTDKRADKTLMETVTIMQINKIIPCRLCVI